MPRRSCVFLLLLMTNLTRGTEPAAEFTVSPLAGSVSVLQGFDNNIVVSVGDDGIVMVDTGVAEAAKPLLAALRRLSGKPIRFVIDTHAHSDHSGGNPFFQKLAPVISSGNVRQRLTTGNEKTRDKPMTAEGLPVVTFEGEMTLHLNGEEIRLLRLPPAHTDGDVVVFFRKANVVAMGDVYMSPAASFGDRWYGGGMLNLIDALESLLPQIPTDAKIVPGHGFVSTRADVLHGLDVLKQMAAVVEKGIEAGKTLEQLTAERPFDQFRSSLPSWASSDKSLDGWLRNFHRELSSK
jgi:glyoxylase-like metal-dependent hydrolase (beta-lactamase superfamily II)